MIPIAAARARRAAAEQKRLYEVSPVPAEHRHAEDDPGSIFTAAFDLVMKQRAALRSRDIDVARGLDAEEARISADQDCEGLGEEFVTPSDSTRALAKDLANRIIRAIPWKAGRAVQMPRFASAPDGGVSLHWRSARYEILVVVPADSHAKVEYYGDTPSGDEYKGSFSGTTQAKSIAEWIAAYEFSG